MFITVDPARLPDIIPLIRPGDRTECLIDKFKVKLHCDIQEVTAAGVHVKISDDGNHMFKRVHGWSYTKLLQEIYFVSWDKVERIYMKHQ